ncbi:MAG TPA: hypothetical protein PKE59_00380 [Novosphingobium sp.]|nr:hypothetical protein [Novosphingobium sp.]
MKTGDKFKADGEVRRYTVQAADDRFVIMTKPFAAQRTYLYTIADLKRGVRGACNLIFGLPCDVDSPASASVALGMMAAGDFEVSHRNVVNLSPAEMNQLAAQSR